MLLQISGWYGGKESFSRWQGETHIMPDSHLTGAADWFPRIQSGLLRIAEFFTTLVSP